MPSNEDEAAVLFDADLERANTRARLAADQTRVSAGKHIAWYGAGTGWASTQGA
jgi:hypothetical protein